MKTVLTKCKKADFEYISQVLDSYISFTDDVRRKNLLHNSANSDSAKSELITLIDKQIRYYGSSDVAYAFRSLFSTDGGISEKELIEDVCNKLKVTIKSGASADKMLERLVSAIVEKELCSKSPDELAEEFVRIGVGNADATLIKEHLKTDAKVAVLPIVVELLGPEIALGIIETIIVRLIAEIIGREAAKVLVKEVIKRNPWLNSLGPIMWGLSAAWLAFDLQGPAFRKTVPICLYLGVVGMRDGTEDVRAAA